MVCRITTYPADTGPAGGQNRRKGVPRVYADDGTEANTTGVMAYRLQPFILRSLQGSGRRVGYRDIAEPKR